jgi:hypothetical protein
MPLRTGFFCGFHEYIPSRGLAAREILPDGLLDTLRQVTK